MSLFKRFARLATVVALAVLTSSGVVNTGGVRISDRPRKPKRFWDGWFSGREEGRELLSPLSISVPTGISLLHNQLSGVYRQGWPDLHLHRKTESSAEHTHDSVLLLDLVSPYLGLTVEELIRGRHILQFHEVNEVGLKHDNPVLPITGLPRGRTARIAAQLRELQSLTREIELERHRQEWERDKELIWKWVTDHFQGVAEQSYCMDCIEDFYLLKTRVGKVCFDVHALQPAWKAVRLVLEPTNTFSLGDEQPFLLRADKLILIPKVREMLEELKKSVEQEFESLTQQN